MSEYGYHEGLHDSHGQLVRAYERLLALYPDEDESNRRAFLAHLRALDLVTGGYAR